MYFLLRCIRALLFLESDVRLWMTRHRFARDKNSLLRPRNSTRAFNRFKTRWLFTLDAGIFLTIQIFDFLKWLGRTEPRPSILGRTWTEAPTVLLALEIGTADKSIHST